MATQRRSKSVEKDAAPASNKPSSPPAEVEIDVAKGHLGVTLSDLMYGVRVDHVDPEDLLAEAGFVTGDVITELDGKAVSHHADALETMMKAKGKLRIKFLKEDAAKKLFEERYQAEMTAWLRRVKMIGALFAVFAVLVALVALVHYTENVPGSFDGTFHTHPAWLRFRKRYLLHLIDPELHERIEQFQQRGAWLKKGLTCEQFVIGESGLVFVKPSAMVTWCTDAPAPPSTPP
jgi:hypothetical protein